MNEKRNQGRRGRVTGREWKRVGRLGAEVSANNWERGREHARRKKPV